MVNKHLISGVFVLTVSVVFASTTFLTSYAQVDNNSTENEIITTNNTFASSLDLIIVPESDGGYGVYEEHISNTFSPGEDIVLYVEPIGFSYKPVAPTAPNNQTLYLMNFTADLVITDPEGSVLGGFQDLPISQIVSHHQNKEVNLVITLSQSEPFPEGNYELQYTVHDVPSGNTLEIAKDITITTSENT
jgi:hypothetical protein